MPNFNGFDVEIEEQFSSDFSIYLKFVDGSYGVLEHENGISYYQAKDLLEFCDWVRECDSSDLMEWLIDDLNAYINRFPELRQEIGKEECPIYYVDKIRAFAENNNPFRD